MDLAHTIFMEHTFLHKYNLKQNRKFTEKKKTSAENWNIHYIFMFCRSLFLV